MTQNHISVNMHIDRQIPLLPLSRQHILSTAIWFSVSPPLKLHHIRINTDLVGSSLYTSGEEPCTRSSTVKATPPFIKMGRLVSSLNVSHVIFTTPNLGISQKGLRSKQRADPIPVPKHCCPNFLFINQFFLFAFERK